jgi:uncharacterized membrane protein YhaH (DUF805 family)
MMMSTFTEPTTRMLPGLLLLLLLASVLVLLLVLLLLLVVCGSLLLVSCLALHVKHLHSIARQDGNDDASSYAVHVL